MKIKFQKGGTWPISYTGTIHISDGSIVEVDDKTAKRLCDSYPKNFSLVREDSTETAVDVPTGTGERIADTGQNRLMKSDKKRSRG